MKLTPQQETFLNMIKPTIQEKSLQYKILPSLLATLAITISDWGESRIFSFSKNAYHIKQTRDWTEKVYSDKTQIVYDKPQTDPKAAPYYRVYNTHQEGLIDFIQYLATSKRSKNGPRRYESILYCTDYTEAINKLMRCGFMQSYLYMNDDIVYIQNLIKTVEEFGLYEWDEDFKKAMEEEMSKKHKGPNGVPQIKMPIVSEEVEDLTEAGAEEAIEDIDFKPEHEVVKATLQVRKVIDKTGFTPAPQTKEEFNHMYRVRLDWEKPDTQIFASPIFEDAKKEALKHEGYKIYIDDDGILVDDPWAVVEEVEEPTLPENIKAVIYPVPGKKIVLKNATLYRTAIEKASRRKISGTFVFHDRTLVDGRAKIITQQNYDKGNNVKDILGWIEIE